MIKLFRFLIGYLQIKFSGDNCERILNTATKKGINLWKIRCENNNIFTYIKVSDFKKLRSCREERGIKIKIIKKMGLPFYWAKHRKRIGFLTGAVIFLCVLNFLSQFIWLIEVKGAVKTPVEDILNACEELNIKSGVLKNRQNTTLNAQKLLLLCPKLAWASLNIEGSKLTVNVTEVKENSDENAPPCNIVAGRDGIIKKIDIVSGNSVVTVNDVVKKGDVLVSGVFENMKSTVFVVSSGEIYAQTEHTITVSEKYDTTVIIDTKKRRKKTVLNFFGLNIPLYLGNEKGLYNSQISSNNLELFDTNLPISLTVKEFTILSEEKINYSRDNLLDKLEKDAQKQIKELGDIEIISREQRIIETDDGIILETLLVCIENIGVKSEILLNSIN